MRVLVGCEYSGRVRQAFRNLGHDAWSCDLLESEDGSPFHIQGDVLTLLSGGWDLAIFHPPCTYLTSAAEWAYGDGPYHQRVKPDTLTGAARREARREAIEFVQLLMGAPIYRIAIENPVGVLSSEIRKPEQVIQPWWFGDDASKATCLWLKNLPPLVKTKVVEPRLVCCGQVLPDGVGAFGCPCCLGDKKARPRWGNQTDSGQNKLSPSADRWKIRSETYLGIAAAMAEQWGKLNNDHLDLI